MFQKVKNLWLPIALLALWAGAAYAQTKLSQLGSGGTLSSSTDQLVTVRNGGGAVNPDVLTTLACSSLSNAAASCSTDTTNAGNISSGTLGQSKGGTGVNNTATLTLGSSNVNLATLGTGIVKNTTTTGALTDAASADVIGLFTGCSGTQYLGADGACHTAGGSGTVTTTGSPASGNLTKFSGSSSITNGDLSGDGTTSGTLAFTLATVNTNTGPWGSSTAIPNFTVNGKGLITAAGTNAVIAPAGTLTGTTLASNVVTSSLTSTGTLTGGATGSGFTVALGSSTITGTLPYANGGFGSATGIANQIPQVNPSANGFVFNYAMNQSLQTVDSPTFVALTLSGLTASELVATNSSKQLVNITALPNGTTATTQATGDNSTDVATDAFVQAQIAAQVDMHDPVQAATTGALLFSPSYSNGSSGVGATLTATSVGTLIIDGYTPALNDRLLVKNQASSLQNGCYTLTTVGVPITTDYVLTRCIDFNQAANIVYGDTFPVLQGTTNANQQFTMNNQSFTTVGAAGATGQITFAQTSGGSQLVQGTGITITGNTIALTVPVTVANGGTNATSAGITAFNNITGYTASGATGTTSTNLVFSASPTLTGTATAANITGVGNDYLSGGYIETGAPFTANTSTSYALNIDNGPKQVITITGAVAITLATPTHAGSATFKLLEDGSGHVYSITGCKWPGGTAITYSTAANAYDIVSVWYDGTNSNCMGGAAFQ